MSTRPARMRSFLLLALCAALTALIAQEYEQGGGLWAAPGVSDEASEKSSGAKPRALPSAAFGLPPAQQFNEIVERTLFEASRRPAPEEADEMPAAAAAELRDLTLTGVVITPEAKVALFRDKTPNQVIRLEPGNAFGKWLLDEVRENGVTLRRGLASREFRLYEVEDGTRPSPRSNMQAARTANAGETPAAQAKQSTAMQTRAGDAPLKPPRFRPRSRRAGDANPAPELPEGG